MPDLVLGENVIVVVEAPTQPVITMEPPVSDVVIVVPVVGPPGEEGPQGPAGSSGTQYTFTQLAPAATWTINHNLDAYPAFLLFPDSSPDFPVVTDVTYPDSNTTVVTWPSPESGRAEA